MRTLVLLVVTNRWKKQVDARLLTEGFEDVQTREYLRTLANSETSISVF